VFSRKPSEITWLWGRAIAKLLRGGPRNPDTGRLNFSRDPHKSQSTEKTTQKRDEEKPLVTRKRAKDDSTHFIGEIIKNSLNHHTAYESLQGCSAMMHKGDSPVGRQSCKTHQIRLQIKVVQLELMCTVAE
jgi:hypothetical protein